MASEAITATTTITRNPSRGSLRSLVSFYYHPTGDKTNSHSLITAPCPRCGHAEPVRSLLAAVEKTASRSSTCTTPATATASNPSTTPASSSSAASVSPGAYETLHHTFVDLEATLARHGAALLELSQAATTTSVFTTTTAAGEKVREPSSHPIVHDFEDLRQYISAVTRLLQTLHEQSSRLDAEARAQRAEREDFARRCAEFDRLREERLADDVGGGGAVPRGRMSKSIDFPDEVRDRDDKSMALSRTMSFTTIDYNPELIWDDDKERELDELENRLVLANRNWSPEQEIVLPQVEHLREERRKAKKHGRYHVSGTNAENSPSRTTSIRTAAVADRRKRSSFSGAFSRSRTDDKPLSAAGGNRRGSAGDAVDTGRTTSGASNRLLRFFSGSKKSE